MTDMNRIIREFSEPDRRYAIYQIIHDGAANPSLAERFDKGWFGGIVGNIPYNISFPDDETAWKNTEAGFREYIRRGMHTWIYDEKGYPSGTAGGYVTENNPEYIAKGLYCYDYWRVIGGPSVYRADVPGDRLWKAVLIPTEGGDPIDVTHCLNKNNVLYIDVPSGRYYLFMMSIRRLFDGTHATESYSEPRNYISLSDKAATEAFVACTHEKYKKILGDEFGKGVLATFTDEPSLIAWNIRTGVFPILPWLDSYPADFESKYGYPFVNACVAVVLGRGNDIVKRRCDFWEFIADTVADGFFGVIEKWCHENGLKSSGHMLEEERFQAHLYNYGSFFRSMRRFDWPGIDQLATETESLMYDGHIPIARFIASFADLNGEHEVFTEFSDHSVRERGEKAGLDCYYGSVNWHLAMGVNNFTSYYSWDGITEEEKVALNRYVARSGQLLRLGSRDSRVALLYPEAAMWASFTPSTKARAIDDSEPTLAVENAFSRAAWDMLHRQVDFDYIDSKILCEAAIKEGRLVWGDRAYSAVVMPCARVLEKDAAKKLLDAVENGIDVFFCGELPKLSREKGEADPVFGEIEKSVNRGEMKFAKTVSFGDLLDANLNSRHLSVKTERYEPSLLSHCRLSDDGIRIVYIANMGKEDYVAPIKVFGECGRLFEANAFTGEVSEKYHSPLVDGVQFDVCIHPGEGKFFIIDNK